MTALLTGAVAALAFGLPFEQGLLIGAVLSPTDPAILIPLFVASRLRLRVAQTVIAESAFNDPTGAVLALAVAGALLTGEGGIGGAGGGLPRRARAQLGRRHARRRAAVGDDLEPAQRASCATRRRSPCSRVVAVSYVSLDFAGGSGYLGAFLAGLIVGNMELLGLAMHSHHEDELRISSRTLSEVVTIFVFLVVGASLPFDDARRQLGAALAVVAVLLLVARPVTVLACTLPDRRARWTRARARVPVLDARDRRRAGGARRRARGPGRAERRPARGRRRARDRRHAAAPGRARAVAGAPPRAARAGAYSSRLTAATLPVLASTRTVVSLRVPVAGGRRDGERDRPVRAPVEALAHEPDLRALRA